MSKFRICLIIYLTYLNFQQLGFRSYNPVLYWGFVTSLWHQYDCIRNFATYHPLLFVDYKSFVFLLTTARSTLWRPVRECVVVKISSPESLRERHGNVTCTCVPEKHVQSGHVYTRWASHVTQSLSAVRPLGHVKRLHIKCCE